ncbi:hypothetical protein HanRHA438_Chr13g0612051 [Helianthus annuus]|nr:hypothetical protein HanIR_Chr13g0654371 [Helianthus annuus]KAJ0859403.1 hypothetical protein HanRHA438_Chr13g0612051 [Helianthus annuus]
MPRSFQKPVQAHIRTKPTKLVHSINRMSNSTELVTYGLEGTTKFHNRFVVMKRAQNVAQAVVRINSTGMVMHGCTSSCCRHHTTPTNKFSKTSRVLEKNHESLATDTSLRDHEPNSIDHCSSSDGSGSGSGSGHDDTDEEERSKSEHITKG